jgi:hypothetical protein
MASSKSSYQGVKDVDKETICSVGSRSSTTSIRALKLEAAARKAELAYRAEAMKKRQELEREELLLMQRRKEEELQRVRELEELKWRREM